LNISNVNVYGLKESIKASGYPMMTEIDDLLNNNLLITNSDISRAEKLGNSKSGHGHDCFLKGIIVQFDLTMPQYFWPQFQRYHFADFVSSQSKMHRINKMDIQEQCNKYVDKRVIEIAKDYIDQYNQEKNQENFQLLMSNIPLGLNLTARITTNYLQLKNIYFQRKNHKLKEWHYFCDWLRELPMFGNLVLQGDN
jgi:hypothetical protein